MDTDLFGNPVAKEATKAMPSPAPQMALKAKETPPVGLPEGFYGKPREIGWNREGNVTTIWKLDDPAVRKLCGLPAR